MAEKFGGPGPLNVKRFVSTPAFLIIAGVAALALVWLFLRGRQAGNAGAQAGVVANPVTGPAEGPQVLGSVDTSGLSAQLSNLVQQVSSANAGGTAPSTQKATVRDRGALANTAFAGWDLSGVSGPPVYTDPGGTHQAGTIPFGSNWAVLGFQNGMVEVQGPAGQPEWIASRDVSSFSGA